MKRFTVVSRRARSIARWSLLAVFCVAVLTACANRGMMVATGTGGASGDSTGSGGSSSGDGTGGAGSGGSSGEIGTGGTPVVDSSADATGARDASTDHACPMTTFTFEGGTQGARTAMNQAAAKSITSSTNNHYCGTRALEIATSFSGMTGNTTKAEVFIDLATNQQNLTGKTITIHVAASPEPMPSAYLSLTLITASGSIDLKPSIRPLTTDWQTQSYNLTATDGGVMMVMSLDIQIFDTNGYNGSIFIDDIDIR